MLKQIIPLLLFINAANVFAIGGKGPLEMAKDGVQNKRSVVLDKIGIDEHLGEKIDLDLAFTDEKGSEVLLKQYFTDKPVFLMLIYYECPTLCNLHLNSLMKTFQKFEWNIGDKFEFVAVSIDPEESPKLAEKKLNAYLKEYGKPETRKGWHFLTGKEENIKKLASQIGFKYAWDANQEQWAHSAAAYTLTPDGTISYYHYGLDIKPETLRLSLVEASQYKIGNIVDRLVLFCMQYDPNKKTYSFYALNVMRLGGVLTILIFGFLLFRFWRKEHNTDLKGKNV